MNTLRSHYSFRLYLKPPVLRFRGVNECGQESHHQLIGECTTFCPMAVDSAIGDAERGRYTTYRNENRNPSLLYLPASRCLRNGSRPLKG